MEKKRLLYIGITVAVVAVVGIAVLALTSQKPETTADGSAPKAYVQITDDGFVPETIKVAAGTEVIWQNGTETPLGVASNPHPSHTALPGLDSKDPIAPGAKYNYTFNKSGKYIYHNESDPKVSGMVIVDD
jgi:plastocyanin